MVMSIDVSLKHDIDDRRNFGQFSTNLPVDGDVMSSFVEGCKFIGKELVAELKNIRKLVVAEMKPGAIGPAKYVVWLDDLIERTGAFSMEPSMVETFPFPRSFESRLEEGYTPELLVLIHKSLHAAIGRLYEICNKAHVRAMKFSKAMRSVEPYSAPPNGKKSKAMKYLTNHEKFLMFNYEMAIDYRFKRFGAFLTQVIVNFMCYY